MLRRVVILADDSAHWKIAGLRQLERLTLEINDLAVARNETIQVAVRWSPELPPSAWFLPHRSRLLRIECTTTSPDSADLLLSTRIFLHRNSSSRIACGSKHDDHLSQSFARLAAQVRVAWRDSNATEGCEYLEDFAQIPACEKRFLRRSGKSQDGLVSRFINRPISRAISRVLLRTPITPSAWTLAIFVLPLIGSWFLARGEYANIISGLLFFQLYSILDGCDGEIARAKYSESARGRQLDAWCDVLGNFLLAFSLGYGLSRPGTSGYFFEGMIVALLIATNELILLRSAASVGQNPTTKIDDALYPRHQRMVASSGLVFFGERFAGWLIQLTKRDVAFLVFLFLALAGQPAWILHLLGAVAALSSLLALKAFARLRRSSGFIR